MRLLSLTLLFILSTSATLLAQDVKQPKPPQALADMVSQGSQVFYLGEYEGMKGWALIREGKPEFFYENKERTALVMGLLFNEGGEMLTMAQLKELNNRVGDDMYATTGGALSQMEAESAQAPAITPVQPQQHTQSQPNVNSAPIIAATTPQNTAPLSKAELMYTDLISANWITLNPQGQYDVFAFIDPNCPHCQKFVSMMDKDPKNVRLRIIPMGVQEDGLKRAAVLLSSNDPDRLVRYANGDKGALSAPDNISLEAVKKNFSVMVKHGFDVTPIVVYRTGKGAIRLIRGRPRDMDMVVDDIKNN